MSVTVELTVKYFSTASYTSVEYMVTEDFESMERAKLGADRMVSMAMLDAMNEDDAMMETFYYEWDYLVDADYAKCLELADGYGEGQVC